MEYWDQVADVAAAHRAAIEGDLDQLRTERRRVGSRIRELDRRIAAHEALLYLAAASSMDTLEDTGDFTLHEAMAEVLRDSPENMLRAPDLAREVNRRGLYRMRDGRPVEAQQIHARVGHYEHMFTREGTFIKLVDR